MIDVIHIEPTNRCQLNCDCCGDKKTRPIGQMTLDNFREIAGQAYKLNPNVGVRLFLSGDPLLHPEIDVICKTAIKIGLQDVVIHTNGYALTPVLTESLIVSGLPKISFSLDNYHIKNGDGGRLIGWEALAKVKHFVEQNHLYGKIYVTVQALVTTRSQADNYRKLFMKHLSEVDHILIKKPHSWDYKGSVADAIRNNNGSCKFLKNRAAIYWNGDAALCCADLNGRLILGNVFTPSFNLEEAVNFVNEIGEKVDRKEVIAYPLPCKTCERYPN